MTDSIVWRLEGRFMAITRFDGFALGWRRWILLIFINIFCCFYGSKISQFDYNIIHCLRNYPWLRGSKTSVDYWLKIVVLKDQFMTCYLIFNFRATHFSYFRKITAITISHYVNPLTTGMDHFWSTCFKSP